MVGCCSCGRGFRPIFVNALILGLHVDAVLVWFGIVICFGFFPFGFPDLDGKPRCWYVAGWWF